ASAGDANSAATATMRASLALLIINRSPSCEAAKSTMLLLPHLRGRFRWLAVRRREPVPHLHQDWCARFRRQRDHVSLTGAGRVVAKARGVSDLAERLACSSDPRRLRRGAA